MKDPWDEGYMPPMELRDYFAAIALPVLIKALTSLTNKELCGHSPAEACAITAYEYADQMLKARK